MRSWRIPLLLAWVVLFGVACGDDTDPPPAVDDAAPEVEVLFPPDRIDDLYAVRDSTRVYVGATDPSGVARVTLYFQRPSDVSQTEIGTGASPIPYEQVPDSIQQFFTLPEGWSLYEFFWNSQSVQSGTETLLFAAAFDGKDNRAVSTTVTVQVLNQTDLQPPDPDFDIRPPTGDTRTVFEFDPTLTQDNVDELADIRVRWDFEGDGIWDVDWDQNARADESQTFTYVRPGAYQPRMQARNTYFEGDSQIVVRQILVTGIGGRPRPPASMADEFVEVPAGVYTRGAANPKSASRNELPAHQVRLTSSFLLLTREVTNAEYLAYLEAAIDSARVEFQNNQIFATDSTGFRYMDLGNSRIFFNIDADGYQIEPGFDDHPVTGVTWYGANDFAYFYGLRLPTEAEWEVAARGDSLYYRYSHGRDLTDGDPTGMRRVNYEGSGDPFEGNRGTTPVKFYDGRTFNGFETIDTGYEIAGMKVYDMSGNAAEWVSDWYGSYPDRLVTNPQGPITGIFKVVRGGSFERSASACRVTARDGEQPPTASYPSIGFRVAYFPPPPGATRPGR